MPRIQPAIGQPAPASSSSGIGAGALRRRKGPAGSRRSSDRSPTPAEVAHNVNNLLAIISGNIQNIAAGLKPPLLQRAIADAVRACELAAATNAVLLRDRRGVRSFSTPTNARTITNNLVGILESLLGPSIILLTKIDDDGWTFDVNSNDISAAIVNLAINARHAMPTGGTFIIRAANVIRRSAYDDPLGLPVGKYVRLSFHDTGVGMSADELAQAGRPHFTVRKSSGGMGLGLPSTKKFARSCGGVLTIHSTEGVGTEVALLLPAQPPIMIA